MVYLIGTLSVLIYLISSELTHTLRWPIRSMLWLCWKLIGSSEPISCQLLQAEQLQASCWSVWILCSLSMVDCKYLSLLKIHYISILCTYSVSHIITYPSKELCGKMALGEVGVSLPWWCHALVHSPPGYSGLFLNPINFSIMEKWPVLKVF